MYRPALILLALAACSDPSPAPLGVTGDGSGLPGPGPGNGTGGSPASEGEGEGGAAPGEGTQQMACMANGAFWATGMSFTEPTPYALATALSASLYGYDGHGLSVIIQGDELAASATEEDDQGVHGFTDAASFAPIARDRGGIRTMDPVPMGWLRLGSHSEAARIQLETLALDVRATDDCAQIFVVLDAVIPRAAGGAKIFDGEEWHTVAELAGGDESLVGWPIRALFQGESITFDFDGVSP